MRKLLLIALIMYFSQIFAQVSVTVHHYDYFNLSANFRNTRSTVSVYARKNLGPSFSVTSFSLVNKKWGESLIGLEYRPLKWLSLEGEVGIETNIESYGYKKNLIRIAQVITVSTSKFLFLGTFEQGSMPWFDLRSFYLLKQVGIGMMASQYYGVGPVVQYHIGKGPFTLWSSWIYDWDTFDYGSMVGIYFKM
jgi:hypothetical protein